MADSTETTEQQTTDEQHEGGNGGGHKGAVRAAAIAAATGATAFAAKKALSNREQTKDARQKPRSGEGGDDESMVGAMLVSGWHAAKDSLLPFAEDAAGAAGEWVARNGPELVRDTLVPRFIRGFERARKSGDDE